ncbi:MAG TPA: FAD-binding oxidoreductase [Alphaproteobacteria bacterium]|nr:FAD-binding oxidoreductase [Alphaproteobacteria bacterium]
MITDFLVIGAGIAGASIASRLSEFGRVVLLEREERPGYHTTGRSAAFFTVNYGNQVIRSLTAASRQFFSNPPDGFTNHPLMSPRGILTIARADQFSEYEQNLAGARAVSDDIAEIGIDDAVQLFPTLRRDYVSLAHYEPGLYMDVDQIHGGYLRQMTAHGGTLVCDAEARSIEYVGGVWNVGTPAGVYEAPILINAAGAWADEIASLAGVDPVGLNPMRRTVIIFAGPAGVNLDKAPMVIDVEEKFYFKPEAGKILASPADETPSPPCDVQPDELDIAVTVERVELATNMVIGRIDHKWAGLRSFVADRTPVVGFDPGHEGFFWLVGQGGYGIMTSPAMAHAATALATKQSWPEDLAKNGVCPEKLSPLRPALLKRNEK